MKILNTTLNTSLSLANLVCVNQKKIYKHVIQKIKLPPENILFIDDLGINLKPAKKLGFFTYKYVNITDTKNF